MSLILDLSLLVSLVIFESMLYYHVLVWLKNNDDLVEPLYYLALTCPRSPMQIKIEPTPAHRSWAVGGRVSAHAHF